MYKYLLMFVLGSPLMGIWLVEGGSESLTTGIPGEENGATLAFALYAVVLSLVAWLTANVSIWPAAAQAQAPAPATPDPVMARREFMQFSRRLLLINIVFLFAMLFGFGGIKVWLGTMEKGLFRASLGPLGALPYMMTKFTIPALFAYLTVLLVQSRNDRGCKRMWWLNAFVVFVAASTWGFKTTGLFMMLPGLLILNWKLSIGRLLAFAGVFLASLVALFFWFDSGMMADAEVFTFLFGRLTVLQGDLSWYLWGLYKAGTELPNYWPTLFAAAGDTVLGVFISKSNPVEWMSYHYDWMLTHLSGSSLEAIANGHSVTGTPFAEGVIAGGRFGVGLFAVVGGLLAGGVYRILSRAIHGGRAVTAALVSTYFCFHVFAWLNGGGITQLFHISVIANIAVAYFLLKLMAGPRHRRAAEPFDLTNSGELAK